MKEFFAMRTPLHCNALLPTGPDTLLVGQYELNDAAAKENRVLRQGRIDLLRFSNGSDGSGFSCQLISSLQLPGCGVFEMIHVQGGALCAAGCTDGSVKFIGIQREQEQQDGDEQEKHPQHSLTVLRSAVMGKEMVTSLVIGSHAAAATSGGAWSLCTTHHEGTVSVLVGDRVVSFKAHDYDAWTIARCLIGDESESDDDLGLARRPDRYAQSPNWILTGGDDAKLKLWDLTSLTAASDNAAAGGDDEQQQPDALATLAPTASALFGAGVVSIVPLSPFVCLVGTYDEQVHLIDLRKLRAAAAAGGKKARSVDAADVAVSSSVPVGGGAWRLRELSAAGVASMVLPAVAVATEEEEQGGGAVASVAGFDRFFAVAAMHAGARVVGLNSATGELRAFHWSGRATPLHNFSVKQAAAGAAAAAAEEQPEEPLVYDVAEMLTGDVSSLASVSFYANELKLWRN
jgi:hypothetical protein